ncbi:MAG: AmmeMemoRadiSam system radical SAM enzyme [Eubacterium sp.]|nr:AmmeMemoRadiSam system radical SAM enzyme [Eubacterium sp.]
MGKTFKAPAANQVTCTVCSHHCRLIDGQTGFCRARKNSGGRIVPLYYGRVCGLSLDPIEKKPLAMFHPGTRILSVGSLGCNLRCPFCQNYHISQAGAGPDAVTAPPTESFTPEELAQLAVDAHRARGNIGLAFTYNEPLVGYEFVRDTSRLTHEAGLLNAVVTNGSVSLDVLEEILPYIDAMNVDLKSFSSEFYEWIRGDLNQTRAFIERAAADCHVEVTTLIIDGKNDSPREMDELSAWIASVSPDIPLHITRSFPQWKMPHLRPTPLDRLRELADTAQRNLNHVFLGNC